MPAATRAPDGPAPTSLERIIAHIEEHPGCTPSHLRATTGLAWGTVGHHVQRLVRSGRVRRVAAGRSRLLLSAAAGAWAPSVLADRLRDGRRVLEALARVRQASVGDLVDHLGSPRSALRRQLRILVTAGLVHDLGTRRSRYVLSHLGRNVAAGWGAFALGQGAHVSGRERPGVPG